MANKKSAKKRIVQTAKKNEINSIVRSTCRTAEKNLRKMVEEENTDGISAALKTAQVSYDSAVSKGVYHKKMVARKVGRLTKLASTAS